MSKRIYKKGPRGFFWEAQGTGLYRQVYLVPKGDDRASVGMYVRRGKTAIVAHGANHGFRVFRTVAAAQRWLVKEAKR